MISDHVTVVNRAGLHAKPASLFVRAANRFVSEIYISKGATRVNAKSIMGVMILEVQQGDEILIEAAGDDEGLAIRKLKELIENRFGLPE